MKRPCEDGHGAVHNPVGPIHTSLSFAQVQALARAAGKVLSCSLCGHRFPAEGGTTAHDCKQPLFKGALVEVKPMASPSNLIFYLDYKYGTQTKP